MARKKKFGPELLGRHPHYDFRNFRLSDYITVEQRQKAARRAAVVWDLPFIPDQGATGHCVGFGWLSYGNCDPVKDGWPNDRGHEIYYKAKEYDGEPGQENGSTTLSGVKAFMNFGVLENNAYAFASSVEDIKVWLLTKSPVIVGTNWYYDMFSPDGNGLVHVGGSIAGGHEYLLVGYDRATDLFKCANSWGTSFGLSGFFYIAASDLERLMREEGDACTAVEIAGGPTPPPPAPEPGCVAVPVKLVIRLLQKLIGE